MVALLLLPGPEFQKGSLGSLKHRRLSEEAPDRCPTFSSVAMMAVLPRLTFPPSPLFSVNCTLEMSCGGRKGCVWRGKGGKGRDIGGDKAELREADGAGSEGVGTG